MVHVYFIKLVSVVYTRLRNLSPPFQDNRNGRIIKRKFKLFFVPAFFFEENLTLHSIGTGFARTPAQCTTCLAGLCPRDTEQQIAFCTMAVFVQIWHRVNMTPVSPLKRVGVRH